MGTSAKEMTKTKGSNFSFLGLLCTSFISHLSTHGDKCVNILFHSFSVIVFSLFFHFHAFRLHLLVYVTLRLAVDDHSNENMTQQRQFYSTRQSCSPMKTHLKFQ